MLMSHRRLPVLLFVDNDMETGSLTFSLVICHQNQTVVPPQIRPSGEVFRGDWDRLGRVGRTGFPLCPKSIACFLNSRKSPEVRQPHNS